MRLRGPDSAEVMGFRDKRVHPKDWPGVGRQGAQAQRNNAGLHSGHLSGDCQSALTMIVSEAGEAWKACGGTSEAQERGQRGGELEDRAWWPVRVSLA